MKAIHHSFGLWVLLAMFTFSSCEIINEANSPSDKLYQYGISAPNEVPTLGRVLFYDTRLSANNTVSCASCHKQSLAFADNKKFSRGFDGEHTTRNSMAIQNIVDNVFNFASFVDSLGVMGEATALFWDGRQKVLQTMVKEPIQSHIEMGTTDLEQLATELSQIEMYQTLFSNAFPDQEIMPENIATALSAFLVSIRSTSSKFDMHLNGIETLTTLEQMGKDLFFDKYNCNSCHQLQAAVNGYQLAGTGEFGGFADIGLDEVPADAGLFQVTGMEEDKGKFKIPSLRNVALTSPYMHDGRFETLEEVIDHYSEEIKASASLDERLREPAGGAKKFDIPLHDKEAIIAFLNTMTDFQMTKDPKFSDPFPD
jgi:cytochrome c peroxidase